MVGGVGGGGVGGGGIGPGPGGGACGGGVCRVDDGGCTALLCRSCPKLPGGGAADACGGMDAPAGGLARGGIEGVGPLAGCPASCPGGAAPGMPSEPGAGASAYQGFIGVGWTEQA